LWSSPAAKDRLRRVSAHATIHPSFPENTDELNRHLMEDAEDSVPDAPLQMAGPTKGLSGEIPSVEIESGTQVKAGQVSDSPVLRLVETQDENGPRFTLRMNLKRLREQEALDDVLGQAEKRQRTDRNPE
jgi:hypothetical protein